jgi:uncharacterized protein YcnI
MTRSAVRPSRRVYRRVAAAAVLCLGALVVGAAPASAHVSVDAGGAGQGADDVVLTFRVPNERSEASTVVVDIKFPTRTPIGSVKPEAKPGWTVTTKRERLATPITTPDGDITQGVTEVIYKATSPATGIQADTFESFRMLVGPMPTGVSTVAFPTVQTYSNGQVSSWIEPTVAGSEPAHPAPILTLGPAEAAAAPGGVAAAGGAAPPEEAASREQVRNAQFVAVVGVVTGSLGLLGAGIAIGRSRRQPDPSPSSAG